MAKISQKAWYALTSGVRISNLKNRVSNTFNIRSLKKDICDAFAVAEEDVKAQVRFIEHHRCHIASAFHVSPFESSAILSVDGMGDFTSTMRAVGKGTKIQIIDSISYPHSLGMLYTAFTQSLGFPHYGDEYKLMGLSPYGEPRYTDRILGKVIHLSADGRFKLEKSFFRHFTEGVSMSWNSGAPEVGPLYSMKFISAFGEARRKGDEMTQFHMDLAASVQKVTEEIIFSMAEDLHRRTGLENLCVTGGVAQNSVANGKLIANTSFRRLFVPPAGHDAGTAAGAALYYWHHTESKARLPFKPEPYTGIKFTTAEVQAELNARGLQYETLKDEEIYDRVTDALMRDSVVGWFQGRAEFGPRALGNRSILADPRREDAKALLNEKIKKRESFRPFAPSILREFVPEYFEQSDDVPFMEKVFQIKPEKRKVIPAVTHVNGSGRLQTVTREVNSRYYELISTFYRKTGVPILLNTSFNENEPIVNSPAHAIDCFLRTKMDMLVLENCIISR
jgi:carbamoyltransferase